MPDDVGVLDNWVAYHLINDLMTDLVKTIGHCLNFKDASCSDEAEAVACVVLWEHYHFSAHISQQTVNQWREKSIKLMGYGAASKEFYLERKQVINETFDRLEKLVQK